MDISSGDSSINSSPPHTETFGELKNECDWEIVIPTCDRIVVPNFIRLFVIRRILDKKNINSNTVDELLIDIQDDQKKSIASNVLNGLLNDGIKIYMEKCYNEKEQRTIIEMIFDKIILKKFDKDYQNIITYVENNNNGNMNNQSKCQVFNTNDLMCLIFQFLSYGSKFDGDLIQCSLVNSHWLYHSWHPNSVVSANLIHLVRQTEKCDNRDGGNMSNTKNDNYNIDANTDGSYPDPNNYNRYNSHGIASMWQRLLKVKSIILNLDSKYIPIANENCEKNVADCDDFVMQNIYKLKNLNDITISVNDKQISIVKVIIKNCRKNIRQCSITLKKVSQQSENKKKKVLLSPLKLYNAKDITIDGLHFYIQWSNQCDRLTIINCKKIDKEWCDFVINHCDCSGIKTLVIEDFVSFDFNDNYNYKYTKLMRQLAQQFEKLEVLEMTRKSQLRTVKNDCCMLIFWEELMKMVSKNGGRTRLYTEVMWTDCDKLNEILVKSNGQFKIDEIDVLIMCPDSSMLSLGHMTPMILNSGVEYLSFDNWEWHENVLKSILLLLKKYQDDVDADRDRGTIETSPASPASATLKAIKCDDGDPDTDLETINEFLGLNLIIKQKLFVKGVFGSTFPNSNELKLINAGASPDSSNDMNFYQLFDVFCQSIFSLVIKERIPIDIQVTFNKLESIMNDETALKTIQAIYGKYFDEKKMLKEYKQPQENKYCQPLSDFKVSLEFPKDSSQGTFLATNAQIIHEHEQHKHFV